MIWSWDRRKHAFQFCEKLQSIWWWIGLAEMTSFGFGGELGLGALCSCKMLENVVVVSLTRFDMKWDSCIHFVLDIVRSLCVKSSLCTDIVKQRLVIVFSMSFDGLEGGKGTNVSSFRITGSCRSLCKTADLASDLCTLQCLDVVWSPLLDYQLTLECKLPSFL